MRAVPLRPPGQGFVAVAVVGGLRTDRRFGQCHPEQFTAARELACAMPGTDPRTGDRSVY